MDDHIPYAQDMLEHFPSMSARYIQDPEIIMLTIECPCYSPKTKSKTVILVPYDINIVNNINGSDRSCRGKCGGGGPAWAAHVFCGPVAGTSSGEMSRKIGNIPRKIRNILHKIGDGGGGV